MTTDVRNFEVPGERPQLPTQRYRVIRFNRDEWAEPPTFTVETCRQDALGGDRWDPLFPSEPDKRGDLACILWFALTSTEPADVAA